MSIVKVINEHGEWISIPAVKGETGATPNIEIVAKTNAPGTAASVEKTGTPENPIFTIGIPKGETPEDVVLSVNNITPDDSGNVTLSFPTVTNVQQTVTTLDGEYPILTSETAYATSSQVASTRYAKEVTINPSKSTINFGGGNVSGHVYLTEANENSSTSNKSQIVFGTPSNNHVVLSSNTNALVINPDTSSTTNQIVLYLDKESLFPSGINADVTGNLTGTASKATADASGNVITTTYATKSELASKVPTSHASTSTTYGVGNASNYGHVKLSDAINSSSSVSSGVAATPAAVKSAYDLADSAVKTVNGVAPVNGNVSLQVSAADEIHFGSSEPVDDEIKLWVDTDEVDGLAVTSVNGINPDASGNVNVDVTLTKDKVTSALGYTPLQTAPVTSVMGATGDVTGLVKSVNGTSADANGELTIDIPSSVHVGTSAPSNSNIKVWIDTDGVNNTAVLSVNNIKPNEDGNVTLVIPSDDITTALGYTPIAMVGNRGSLAGYEAVSSTSTINNSSADSNEVSSNVTIQNGTSGTAWTKIVRLTAAVSVTIGSKWKWINGETPTIVAGGILVCTWCGSGGIVSFLSPSA